MSSAPTPLAGPSPAPDAEPDPPSTSTPAGTPRWVRQVLLANLVCEIGIVVTGGLVRVTGSGLGCPTWPECVPGSFTPVAHQAQGYHKNIEFGNRLLITVLTIAAVAALLAAVHETRQGRTTRRFAWWGLGPLLGVVAQAVIGGITVRQHLAAATVAAHFIPSMVIIAVSTLLYLAVRPDVVPSRGRELRLLTWAVTGLTAVILVMGTIVTGSGPHSGDAGVRQRFDVNPRDVSWLHSDVVLLFTGLVAGLVLVARLSRASVTVQRRTWWVLGVTLLQGVIGYVEYATRLPMLLVVVHMLGASLLVVAVTALTAAVTGTTRLTGRHPTPLPLDDHAEV